MMSSAKALLKKLNIEEVNAGACSGPDTWIKDPKGKELVSYNPSTGEPIAKAIDQVNIEVRIPAAYRQNVVQFVAEVMETRIFPPQNDARVVINERNGVIIVGDNVEVGPVAVSHKNLSIETEGPLHVVDPAADTSTTKLLGLVKALNALKVETQDIIDIIKELERSGRLYGHVIIE